MTLGLFPGQGIQAKIVLQALEPDDPYLQEADELLGYDLRRRTQVSAGNGTAVLPTSIAQPAIFVAGLISWRRAMERESKFNCLAGHSLGEYAALVAGGAISFGHGLCAVAVRAEAMQRAARSNPGGMVAVLGLDLDQASRIADEAGAWVANDNAPGQVVISGSEESLAAAGSSIRAAGGRSVLLDVSGPFHSPAMKSAAHAVRDTLDHISIRNPRLPVISNVTARPYRAPGEIRKCLVLQLTERVRFRESLRWLWDHGVRGFEDIGPGDVAAGLVRRSFRAFADDEEMACA